VAAATKIFASNLNAKMAQRFYNLILLPHVRNDMEQNKKLNWHLYMALKKSVFKPAAFYKGIVLPLCEVRPCPIIMCVFHFSLSLGLADLFLGVGDVASGCSSRETALSERPPLWRVSS